MNEQEALINSLWCVFYGSPVHDEQGVELDSQQILAKALIVILDSIELPEGTNFSI